MPRKRSRLARTVLSNHLKLIGIRSSTISLYRRALLEMRAKEADVQERAGVSVAVGD